MCLRQCWWVLVRNVWQRTESPNNMENKAWLIVIWAMSLIILPSQTELKVKKFLNCDIM